MKEEELRVAASEHAWRISRDIESLLQFFNDNEDSFTVSRENTVKNEHEFHEDIAKYMKLGLSFENLKPE